MSDNNPDIWRLQAQLDTPGLVAALNSDNPSRRKRAAAALRAMGAKDSVPALRVALVNEQDPDARASIAAALETLTDEDEVEILPSEVEAPSMDQTMATRLIQELNRDDQQGLIRAARELGDLGDKLAVEPLVMVFKDARHSIQVRLAVAEALLKLESAPVEVALLANLRNTEWSIRRNGAAILGQLRAEWAVEPLARAMRDPNAVVRRTARAALKNIGTPEARRILARYNAAQSQTNASGSGSGSTVGDTQPVAPRGGLLKHIQLRDNEAAQESDKDATGQKPEPSTDQQRDSSRNHLNPTQPLDPKVLEDMERYRQSKPRDKDDS